MLYWHACYFKKLFCNNRSCCLFDERFQITILSKQLLTKYHFIIFHEIVLKYGLRKIDKLLLLYKFYGRDVKGIHFFIFTSWNHFNGSFCGVQEQHGEGQWRRKGMSWVGNLGTKPNELPETEGAGNSPLQPYGPQGPKRIGAVRWVVAH